MTAALLLIDNDLRRRYKVEACKILAEIHNARFESIVLMTHVRDVGFPDGNFAENEISE